MSVVKIISLSINTAQPLKLVSSGIGKRVNVNSVLASLSIGLVYQPASLNSCCLRGRISTFSLLVSILCLQTCDKQYLP